MRIGSVRSGRVGPIAVLALASLIAVGAVQPAAASERVSDGSFEGSGCVPGPTGGCSNSSWTQSRSANAHTGPICRSGVVNCGWFHGSSGQVGSHSGSTWAQFGGADFDDFHFDWSIQQVVNIPAAPATLRFFILIRNSETNTGSFAAKLDGSTVFSVSDSAPFYNPYVQASVDVSSFAGGPRTLRFEGSSDFVSGSGWTDSFNLDDVSLDAPDAAHKRCKKGFKLKKIKKKGKPAKKKCVKAKRKKKKK